MKKTSFLSVIISLTVFLFSCGNNNTNSSGKETDSSQTNESKVVETKNADENLLTAKVKFNGVYLSSQGGLYWFETDAGERLDVYDRTEIPQSLKDLTAGIVPNERDPKFENKWFIVEYKIVDAGFYDSGEGKEVVRQVPQIVTIKEAAGGSGNNSQNKTFNLADIKKGDIIYGLKVKSIDYKKGDYFSIQYEGEFTVSGNVQYNDFEDSYDIYPEEKDLPEIKIKAEGTEYKFFISLSIINKEKFLNALSQKQKDELNSGSLNGITITVNNLRAGDFFEGGKGRIGSQAVNFLKIN